MQKIIFINCLCLLLLHPWQQAGAQSAGMGAQQDSLLLIKQLVKEQLLQQLQQTASWKKLQQHSLAGLVKDSAVIDTLGKLVLAQMQQLANTGMHTGKLIVTDAAVSTRQLLKQQFTRLLQTQQVKNLFSQFTGMLHQPLLQWKGGSIEMRGQTAPSVFNAGSVFINNNMLSSNWAVLGIPMSLQFNRQDFTGPEYHSRNILSFRFNREAYLHSLRNQIQLKIKPADLLPDYNDALQKIKAAALGRLSASLDSINQAYRGSLEKQLAQLGDLKSLLKTDMAALQDKLLSAEFLKNVEDKKNQLSMLPQQLNDGGQFDKLLYDSLQQLVQSVTGVNQLVSRIRAFKEEIQQSGLLDKLQAAEQFKNNTMQQWLQEPDKLQSLVKEQLDLNGLQKMFLHIDQLQIGMNAVSLSPLTIYQFTNNGVNASFVNNKIYLFVMAGKQKAFGSLYDNQFTGSLFSADNAAIGARVGRGDLQNSHIHFSLFSYQQQQSRNGNHLINTVPGKTVVATLSHQLKINELNYLDMEVSRSNHKYDNQQSMADTILQGSNLSNSLLRGENFLQQLAFTLQWNGEIKDRQFNYDLHGTAIGRGYSNPGNLFLSRGMMELGGGFKKTFLKNQLQVTARGNYRAYAYGTGNASWRNYNFSFQAKWKLKKGQYLSLRYQPYRSLKLQDDISTSVGGSNRLSLDMHLRRRLGKINYQQVIGLAASRNSYKFDSLPVNNNAVQVSSLQTITLDKHSYYLNLQYNNALKPAALAMFNTQFNCDAGLVYHLGKSLTAATALNYNSTKNWFSQWGIKQSVSGQLGDQFVMSIYAAMLKNIKVYRPNNMENIRIDWSLQYQIK